MSNMNIVGNTDLAELSLWAFFLFFIGLVYYLRREDHREGYPMEDDATGLIDRPGILDRAPKVYLLPHGLGVELMPDGQRDPVQIPGARRTAPWSGSPIEPTGNPLIDGVGPAAWANRKDRPDLGNHGRPRLTPMRLLPGYSVASRDPDPRGMPMVGCDGNAAGIVTDIWIDQSENIVRYVETELDGSGRHVMTPMTMVTIDRGRGAKGVVNTNTITAAQFQDVPGIADPDRITMLEEDKVMGYHGGGYLYATPARQEPLL